MSPRVAKGHVVSRNLPLGFGDVMLLLLWIVLVARRARRFEDLVVGL